MEQHLPEITYPTPQLLLWMQLERAICPEADVCQNHSVASVTRGVAPEEPTNPRRQTALLERVRNTDQVIYRSPVVLQQARQQKNSETEYCTKIVNYITSNNLLHLQHPPSTEREAMCAALQAAAVSLLPSGWLWFQVNPGAIGHWLQYLVQHDLPLGFLPPTLRDPGEVPLLPLQYSHARCCSLLRLGHQVGDITLTDPTHPLTWQISNPLPISWGTAAGQPYWQQQAPDTQLFFQILDTTDRLYHPQLACSPQTYLTLADQLAHSWHRFDANCSLLGGTCQRQRQSRLGLIMIVQRLLKGLLAKGLGLAAPGEL